MKPFIYDDEYLITNSKLDETGRFEVSEDYYKEELKQYTT